jgi:hypothetical protein
MDEGDADRMVERPEAYRKVAGGTREKKDKGCQVSTGVTGKTQPEAMELMEEVLRRENLIRALSRVCSNKGAPGIDDAFEELTLYLKSIGHASERVA